MVWDITGAPIRILDASIDRKKSKGDCTHEKCRWMHKGLNIYRKACIDDRFIKMWVASLDRPRS